MPQFKAEREALLRRAYAAFNARDIDAALAAMSLDVDWPNGMEGGRIRGHDAVRAYWSRQWGMIDPCIELLGFVHHGREVVADVRLIVRDLTGAIVSDAIMRHVYTFEGGLVKGMEIAAAGSGSAAMSGSAAG